MYTPCTSMYPYSHCPVSQAAWVGVSVFSTTRVLQLRFALEARFFLNGPCCVKITLQFSFVCSNYMP